jgi:hypothetical protein
VDEKSKALGRVKEKRVINGAEGKRRRQPNSRVRLSPLDFLSLIQEPFSSTVATNNLLARDLAKTCKRLERLERLAARKGLVLAPRRVHVPNLSKLDALERELREFPTRRRLLTIKQFATFMDVIRRLRRSVAGLAGRVRKCEHRARQAAYLARIGRLFLDAPDEVLESFIFNRRNRAGANVHAVALARKRGVNLPPAKFAEWGRRGAEALWAKRRTARVGRESRANHVESSATERQGASEPV